MDREKIVNETKEMTYPNHIIIEACMDDDIKISGKVFIVGTPGTYVTTPEDNPSFPKSVKIVVERVRPVINNVINRIANKLGVAGTFSTSHEGCGALGLQNIKASDKVSSYSQEFFSSHEDCPPYLVHIENSPKDLRQSKDSQSFGQAEITRPESSHNHHAYGVIYTTGGFISPEELATIKSGNLTGVERLLEADDTIKSQPELKNYFLVSVDWLKQSLDEGLVDSKDAKAVIQFINQLTRSIMQGTLKHTIGNAEQPLPQLEVLTYDAGRLGTAGQANTQLFKELLQA